MNPLRRKFFSGVGLLGGVAAGVAATKLTIEVVEKEKPKEDISHLAPPSNATTISIIGSYGEPTKQETSGQYVFTPMNQQVTNHVALTVGKDNRLWMKIGDEWKRVSIDV